MHSLTTLKRETDEFFRRHWPAGNIYIPCWKQWNLQGIPSEHDSGGCYAVFSGNELLYIGLALTAGRSAREGQGKVGLYNRLRRHVVKPEIRGSGTHTWKTPRWDSITHIELIAFPDDYRYLAAALESYLIGKMFKIGTLKNKAT